ncbi:hypothetical protein [Alkalicoccus luteus]|uniref:hypothetical protein n=1 Tax=Alkalicoccus luteus TaxID=1237094 RepID=UPI00143932BD|nr:hypothetical protein [Alkalicoccus luteus]
MTKPGRCAGFFYVELRSGRLGLWDQKKLNEWEKLHNAVQKRFNNAEREHSSGQK